MKSITIKEFIESGEKEFEEKFRKEYDKLGLKSPKNSMKNLERELIIDYWRKVISTRSISAWIMENSKIILDEFEYKVNQELDLMDEIYQDNNPVIRDSVWGYHNRVRMIMLEIKQNLLKNITPLKRYL